MVLCNATAMLRTATRFGRTRLAHGCRGSSQSAAGKGRYYTKKHEWVAVDAGVGTVGISQYAQDALGEVVFVQLPDIGRRVAAGEECAALESVKAAGEVYTPISGAITETNKAVETTPSLINISCYEDGWLFRIELSTPEELGLLMDQAAYDKYLEESH